MPTAASIGNADLEITYVCNLHCVHCYNPQEPVPELSTEQLIRVIDDLARTGFPQIHITGGEPCIRDDLRTLLEACAQSNLEILLETNGTLLRPEMVADIQNLKVRASIDGTEPIHNMIRRGKGNPYQTAMNNLQDVASLGIPVQVTMSVNRLNAECLYDALVDMSTYGLTDFRLRLSMPAERAYWHWNILKLDPEHIPLIGQQVRKVQDTLPQIALDADTLFRKPPSQYRKFFIDPSGRVKPYPFIEAYVGDLAKDTVADVLARIDDFVVPEQDDERMTSYLSSLGVPL